MELPFQIPDVNLTPDQLNFFAGVAVGVALLLWGRRLYWLFFATIGFLVASLIAQWAMPAQDAAWWWLIPLVVGLIGAFLSVFLQKMVIRTGGVLTGAYLGYFLAEPFLQEPWPWVSLVVGALIGFFLILYLFNGALILLSSLLGAMVLLEPMEAKPEVRLAITGALVLVGCFVQSRNPPKDKKNKES
ncbi:MAG: DUF4203 domain-containing protein [Verrucomicrobia bacterium]|jgi:hypothetical protein|nr:DUF4203 domain-containing protein [Verrucomicrobiota bacterium]